MLLMVMLFLESAIHLTTSQPASPCPSVFQYQLDEKGIWWGMVLVTPVPSNVLLKVSVEMFVHASLPSKYAGKLLLKDGKEKVAERIVRGDSQPIVYQILFPTQNPLPVINKITANEKRICIGSQGTGRVVTTITLEHKLYPLLTTLNVATQPTDANHFGDTTAPLNQNPWLPQKWPTRPPESFIESGYDPFTRNISEPTTTERFILTSAKPSTSYNEEGCGKPIIPNHLIRSGVETERGDWPWLAALYTINTLGGIDFWCSGTLINNKHIVTAAHCLRYRERVELTIETLVVYLGRFNLKKFSEQDAQQVELEQLAIHPDYDSYKYDADLAVLVMKRSIVYNTFIQPICLWDRSPNLGPIVGKFGTVVGWGRDENGNKVTPKPRMAQIPIVTQEECLRSKNDFVFLTSNRTFCAGSRNGTGPCNGDSGSGFILPLPDGTGSGKRWYLRGVVSLSLLDSSTWSCDLNQFVVYTDVAKYATWIQQFRT